MKINKGSSVWQLATGWGIKQLPTNFCDLLKSMFISTILCSFSVFAVSAILGTILGNVVAFIVTGVFVPTAGLLKVPIILGLISIIAFILFVSTALVKGTSVALDSIKDSFVGTAYSSWKEKYCPIVELDK